MFLGKDKKGKSRALDLLDKHMNEKNKSAKSPNPNKNAELENLLRRERIVSSPDTTMDSRGDVSQQEDDVAMSPTPRRRTRRTSGNSADSQIKRRRVFSVTELASQPSEAEYSASVSEIRPNLSQSETTTDSPSSKSVAFSDYVGDDSEIKSNNSSPRHSPLSKPKKSILRNNTKVSIKREPYGGSPTLSLQNQGNMVSLQPPRDSNIGPEDLRFWVSGEIHSIMNPQNVQEFTRLVNGGIKILSMSNQEEYAEKKFEIYASLNNVLSNGALKGAGEVNERKILCLIENIAQISDICIPHLEEEQTRLTANESKKDPFSIRLYVQIVKLFTNILSCFKIIKFLVTNGDQAEKFKKIFQLSLEVLQNRNSNKMMISTQLTFLREEKFSTQLLEDVEIDQIIAILPNIKEIQSTNIICEKLMMIKQFLVKFPKKMVARIPTWLPQEVICRILFSNDQFSTKIGFAAISVLLELLKRCIDHPAGHEKVFESLQIAKATDILPSIHHKSFFSHSTNDEKYKISEVNVSYLLRAHIHHIIQEKKEYKLAMDLWLALMGLLFNNKKRITFLLTDEGKKWIDLNIECLEVKSAKARLLSLKVWRILVFCISNNNKYLESHELIALSTFLIKPIKTVINDIEQDTTLKGVKYLLNDYVFSTCAMSHQQGNHESVSYLLAHLWKPVFNLLLDVKTTNPNRHEIMTQCIMVLLVVVGRHADDESYRGLHPIKVIASEGIHEGDIAVLPPPVFQQVSEQLYDIILPMLIQNQSVEYTSTHLLTMRYISRLASFDLSPNALFKSISLLSALYKPYVCDRDTLKLILDDIISLAVLFKKTIFTSIPTDFRNFILSFESYLSLIDEGVVTLVKKFFDLTTKENISGVQLLEGILSLQDTSSDLCAINWVGTKLLAETVHEYDFLMYSRIVAKIGEPETISNFFDLAEKLEFKVDLEDLLQINVWNSAGLVSFLDLYRAKFNIDILDLLHLLKKCGKIPDLVVFDYIFELVPDQQKLNVLKELIFEYPNLIFASSIKKQNLLLKVVLSIEHLTKLLPYFSFIQSEVKLEMLDRMIRFDMLENIISYKNVIFDDYLLRSDGSALDNQRKSLQINLISYIFDKKCTELFLCVKDLPLLESTAEYLFRLIEKSPVEEILFIPKDVLLKIDDDGLAKVNFTDFIRIFLESKPVYESLDFINMLVSKERVTMITRCKNEIFDFFVGLNSIEDIKAQQVATKVFSDMISMVFANRKKVDISFFSQFVARLPSDASEYLYQLSLGFTKHQQFRAGKFRNSTPFSDLKSHLLKWSAPMMVKTEPNFPEIENVKAMDSESASLNQRSEMTENEVKTNDMKEKNTESEENINDELEVNNDNVDSKQTNEEIDNNQTDERIDSDKLEVGFDSKTDKTVETNQTYENRENNQFDERAELKTSDEDNDNNRINGEIESNQMEMDIDKGPTGEAVETNQTEANQTDSDVKTAEGNHEGIKDNLKEKGDENQRNEDNGLVSTNEPDGKENLGKENPVDTQDNAISETNDDVVANHSNSASKDFIRTEDLENIKPDSQIIEHNSAHIEIGKTNEINITDTVDGEKKTIPANVDSQESGNQNEADNEEIDKSQSKSNRDIANGADFEYNNIEDPLIEVKIPIFKGSFKKLPEESKSPEPMVSSPTENELNDSTSSKPLRKIPIYNTRVKSGYNSEIEKPFFLHEEQAHSSQTSISKLKIPIFNSSLFTPNGSHLISTRKTKSTPPKSEKVYNETAEPIRNELFQNEEEEYLRNENDDSINTDDIQGIRSHFPSRKARKLVSRLRNISSRDMATFSAEEARNIRVELLDFLMKLEFHTISDPKH